MANNFLKPNGAIIVRSGDTISGFCAKIYGLPAAKTQAHWGEFARLRYEKKGIPDGLVPIKNPNRIFAGETIYHLPTARGGAVKPPSSKKKPVTTPPIKTDVPVTTNIWMGVGVDTQYTLGVIGQQLMVFSLRSFDDPSRVGLLLLDNTKAGASVDLTANGYLVLATGTHHLGELHGMNSAEKLDWDWVFALGLNWGSFVKTGKKSVKAAKPLATVVSEGTRIIRRKCSPEVLERAMKIIRESNKSRRQKLISFLKKQVALNPEEVAGIAKNLRKAAKEAEDLDLESAYPRVHFIPVIGAGVGAGVTRNFGDIKLLDVA